MKRARSRTIHTATSAHFFPPDLILGEQDEDEILRELRDMWPSSIDLAKQRGLIYRLHTILNA